VRLESPSVVVIGIGNQLRGDDAAGLEAVRRLRATELPAEVGVLAHEGEGAGLLELWDGVDAVLLVDCVRSGERPGTIHRLDASSAPVASALSHGSSHTISVADAIELARTLGRVPGRVIVYGIEGATLEAGAGLSQEVATALDGLVAAVRAEAMALGRA
jgi:hydrogenase maturation protease